MGWGGGGPDEAGSIPVGGGAVVQHLLAVSDSNRDPLKDEHNRVGWRAADPQVPPMIRVGVQTGI